MSKGRKTFDVSRMKEVANQQLRDSVAECGGTPEYREGIIAMISSILHESGNYTGFMYLEECQVPAFERPGMREGMKEDGRMGWVFDDCDRTRVRFF